MLGFIDTSTGTWGCAEDIVFVWIGPDEEKFLDSASDEQICAFGNENGDAPILGGGF